MNGSIKNKSFTTFNTYYLNSWYFKHYFCPLKCISMLNKRFLILLVLSISAFISYGQHIHNENCGVSIEDQIMSELLHPNDFKGDLAKLRNDVTYVPVKFHLTANDNGSGRLETIHVLNQLCILNRDYAASNIVFYIYEGISYINQTNIYQSAGTNRNAVQSKKSNKAVNIFITQNADLDNTSSGGTTLGFYSPQGDYIVVRKQELAAKTNTLSHEIGHFFNLRHTFYGWEGAPYDKNTHGETVTFATVPGGIPNIPVELVDGSNCLSAADMICDTPPDYNFGLTAGNCSFNTILYDRNQDRVIPMKENQMGYFRDCDTFRFTEGQTDKMLANFNSTTRSYIRSSYVPNQSEITVAPILHFPEEGDTIVDFASILFDWDEVPGASEYLIEIRGSNQYQSAILKETEYLATSLRKNNKYFWTIKPFSDGNGCATVTTSNFRTGDGTSSTYEIAELKSISIVPNPVIDASYINVIVHIDDAVKADFQILSLFGQIISSTTHTLDIGQNNVSINTNVLNSGVYILNIKVDGRNSFTKFVVQ